jgi:hypothetical protein
MTPVPRWTHRTLPLSPVPTVIAPPEAAPGLGWHPPDAGAADTVLEIVLGDAWPAAPLPAA